MFEDITLYIERSNEERKAHLKLDEDCLYLGIRDSSDCRALLAYHLKTTLPQGMKIVLCHACHHGLCSNPNHLYWGTAKENIGDQTENGGKTFAEKKKLKHGDEAYRALQKKAADARWKKQRAQVV